MDQGKRGLCEWVVALSEGSVALQGVSLEPGVSVERQTHTVAWRFGVGHAYSASISASGAVSGPSNSRTHISVTIKA